MRIPDWKSLLRDVVSCLSPSVCISCGRALVYEQQVFCVNCHRNLPVTDFHKQKSNPFTSKFYGRLALNAGAAFLYFSKKGLGQQIVHDLKYRGRYKLGHYVGKLYGEYLVSSPLFQEIDTIVPVPLHKQRLRQRGYNQSEAFGEGLSESLDIPLKSDMLKRVIPTKSQTVKSRAERFANLEGAFHLEDPDCLQNQHILLIDDVLTTGATLESCALELKRAKGIRISIATIGFAYFQ